MIALEVVYRYLPHRGGFVVCGCFNPALNPTAPQIVLPGEGPEIERWAEVFADQSQFVPIFLKRDANRWEYVGDYRVRSARPSYERSPRMRGGPGVQIYRKCYFLSDENECL
jgi:hypothetical protein